jgi:DNA-binding CsgD family transcriptional regulator
MPDRFSTRARPPALIGREDEREVLDRLIDAVRGGESRALVLRGDMGVGKTALLEYLVEQAHGCRVVRAAGVESEMEFCFAGLHQLLAPLLNRLELLPAPQHAALTTAFGLSPGSAPDRFFVALAVLSLLGDVAEEQPLICVVDDEQWLDRASAQALAFVARRLEAESVGLAFAVRGRSDELAGLPELVVEGLSEGDAHALLDLALSGPLDERVRDQIVSETRGNPLALWEIPRSVPPAELAGGFAIPPTMPLERRIEHSFRRRLDALPHDTRRLVQLAAAEPVGDPSLLWRAAERLAIGTDAVTPAVEAGLIEFGTRVRFSHPLVRLTAYRTASLHERHDIHRALADATDPERDPDRCAWHRAQATAGPDEGVADELERSAGRAQARGGLAAAAAFLERAAALTPDPARRAERTLAAARAKRNLGALDEALEMLVAAESGPPDALRAAEVERLRGQIAFSRRRASDAAPLLLRAAMRLDPLDAELARETHLESIAAAISARGSDDVAELVQAAEAARAAPPGPKPPRAADVILDALALRVTEGYAAAAPVMTRALETVFALNARSDEAVRLLLNAGPVNPGLIALEVWDADSWREVVALEVSIARDTGALVQLQFAVNFLAHSHFLNGEAATAVALIEEDRLIAEATGNRPFPFAAMMLAAWQGHQGPASELIAAALRMATAGGLGSMDTYATSARAVLYNALGRHHAARDWARRALLRDALGSGPLFIPELLEAASRTGDLPLLSAGLEWLVERTRVTPTDWALGIEARARALLSEGDAAESLYSESIERLARTRLRVELARAHLVYGEWLRRERRRHDAREQLGTAYDMLDTMGVEAFAERARRELLATGETARKRTVETRDELTAQEVQIARLARDGLSNPEIGARLFISPGTVKYHLRKIFIKLDIRARSELARVLPRDATAGPPAAAGFGGALGAHG